MTTSERVMFPIVVLVVIAAFWSLESNYHSAKKKEVAKCGIFLEQEAHLASSTIIRIKDTCAHLVCIQTKSDEYLSSPYISCVRAGE